jgi:enoyl-CoA hydratase/carnithine racemase
MSDEAAPVVCGGRASAQSTGARKNALTPGVAEQLLYWLQVLEADEEVKVILLRGVGGRGVLLRWARLEGNGRAQKGRPRRRRLWASLACFSLGIVPLCAKPTCCCLEGGAIAGGSGLALAAGFLVTVTKVHSFMLQR